MTHNGGICTPLAEVGGRNFTEIFKMGRSLWVVKRPDARHSFIILICAAFSCRGFEVCSSGGRTWSLNLAVRRTTNCRFSAEVPRDSYTRLETVLALLNSFYVTRRLKTDPLLSPRS